MSVIGLKEEIDRTLPRGKICEAIRSLQGVKLVTRAEIRREKPKLHCLRFLSATVVYPTQREISKMLEMLLNRENGMRRCCSSS